MSQIKLIYQQNFNNWLVQPDVVSPLTERFLENTLIPLSANYCDEDGYMNDEKLPNEDSIISEVKNILKVTKEYDDIDVIIKYDKIST